MEPLEVIARRLAGDPAKRRRLLIGGLLSFVPIVNLLAMGYLYRMALRLRQSGDVVVPRWEDWAGLLANGVRFLGVWLVAMVLPSLCGLLASLAFLWLSLGMLGNFSFIPLGLALGLTPGLFAIALFRHQSQGDWTATFRIWRHLGSLVRHWERFVLVTAVFWGVIFVGWPLYGLAIFVAFAFLLSYATVAIIAHDVR